MLKFGNLSTKRVSMNFIIHIRNVAFASWAKEKTALNSFRACAIWMKEIIGMKADNYIGQKHLRREMSAVIFV